MLWKATHLDCIYVYKQNSSHDEFLLMCGSVTVVFKTALLRRRSRWSNREPFYVPVPQTMTKIESDYKKGRFLFQTCSILETNFTRKLEHFWSWHGYKNSSWSTETFNELENFFPLIKIHINFIWIWKSISYGALSALKCPVNSHPKQVLLMH